MTPLLQKRIALTAAGMALALTGVNRASAAFSSSTGEAVTEAIWPQDVGRPFAKETVVYDSPDDPYAIKIRVARPSLVVYRPDPNRANHAAVLVCPGGGYGRLYLTRGGIDFALFLSEHGYVAALLKYRLPDPAGPGEGDPLPLQDAEQAMRFLRAHAGDYAINPRWIGTVGTSAGGHVAGSLAAFADDGARPDFVILMSAVISMRDDIAHRGSRTNLLGAAPSAAEIERYSLEGQVSHRWPPTLIVVTLDDQISPQNSLRLADALRAAGRPVKLLAYPKGGHAPALFHLEAPLSQWPGEWLNWMAGLTFGRK